MFLFSKSSYGLLFFKQSDMKASRNIYSSGDLSMGKQIGQYFHHEVYFPVFLFVILFLPVQHKKHTLPTTII